MREIDIPKDERQEYLDLGFKCFYIEYTLYINAKKGEIHKREYAFSKSVSELLNVDLPYEIMKFWGIDNYKLDVITISEVKY